MHIASGARLSEPRPPSPVRSEMDSMATREPVGRATVQRQDTEHPYRYRRLTLARLLGDLRFPKNAPHFGAPFPDFDLPTTDGERFRTQDVVGKRPLLLVTASFTCPMAAAAHSMLQGLHSRFGGEVEFVTLYVREAHPGERYEQAATLARKLAYARDLKARDRLPWTVVVDDPDGTVHRALGSRPNMAYVAAPDGTVVYRALCAGDERRLSAALRIISSGGLPSVPESRHRVGPVADGVGLLREMTRHGGPRAERDVWRVAPPVAALAWAADGFRPLPPRWRVVAALVSAGALIVVSASLLRKART